MGLNDDCLGLSLVDDGTMDGFPSILDYHETIEDLKHRLLYTTVELESLRTNAKEEIRRKDEQMRITMEEIRRKEEEMMRREEENYQLSQCLKITTQERDEARDQMQKLLEITQKPNTLNLCRIVVPVQIESPQNRQARGSSSITESDSPSETHNNNNHHSYVSSPVESFFDAATSPDLSNMNMADSCNIGALHQPLISPGSVKYDQGSWIIDCLAAKRPLPEKGKLLQAVQAVTRSMPLLETLLMTGPLPQWRNPPPSIPFQIPPVTVKGCATQALNPTAVANPNHLLHSSLNGLHHGRSQGGFHVSAASIGMTNKRILSPQNSSHQRSFAIRQKTQ